jgi:hypothetical protein
MALADFVFSSFLNQLEVEVAGNIVLKIVSKEYRLLIFGPKVSFKCE